MARVCSYDSAVNALTVAIAAAARSTRVAATAVALRSRASKGPASVCATPCTSARSGTAERMTSVSWYEREKASARQARQVVSDWMMVPSARAEACRMSSVSLS